MQRYKVPEMSCLHCVQAIEKAVRSLDPAAKVACDLETKEVRIETSIASARVAAALAEAGYEPAPI